MKGRPLSVDLLERSKAGLHREVHGLVTLVDAFADALEHAHASQVVHRDLKPQNVMLLDSSATFGVELCR